MPDDRSSDTGARRQFAKDRIDLRWIYPHLISHHDDIGLLHPAVFFSDMLKNLTDKLIEVNLIPNVHFLASTIGCCGLSTCFI